MSRLRSIRSQMVIFFSILLLLPLLIFALYVYSTVQSNLMQSYSRHYNQVAEALTIEIGKWREEYEGFAMRIFGDALVQRYLMVEDWEQTAEHFSLRSELRNRLVSYGDSSEYTRNVYIMNKEFRIDGSTAIAPRMIANLTSLISRIDEAEGKPIWFHGFEEEMIVIASQVVDNRIDLNRKIGYLFVLLDAKELLDKFKQFTLDEGQQFALYDEEHRFMISTSDVWRPELAQRVQASDNGYAVMEAGQDQYAYFAMSQKDWHVATWILESRINEPVRKVLIAFMLIVAALLVFTIVMVIFVSHRITRPLLQLQSAIKEWGSGNTVKVPVLRNDEIGQVANKLNMMSDEITHLIAKNREEEEKRRKLQLQTLEYQINPHFLYNALDSVYMLARKYEDSRISDIVTSLSRLFRIGLNQGREIISVGDEVRHVGYYLKIQGIRFGEQLSWSIDIDPEAEKYTIIKFLLQPLVENSIIHGVRKQDRPGTVTVRATVEESNIRLEVSDDGAGMSGDRLVEVRRSLEREEIEDSWTAATMHTGGFGLRNVHQRIRLHYGFKYGVELYSQAGGGTTAVIRLPLSEAAAEAAAGEA